MARQKLRPIADRVAAKIRKHGLVDEPMLEEIVLDEVHFDTYGQLDWVPTDIVVGMVLQDLRRGRSQ